MVPGIFEFPVEQDVAAGTIWEGGEIWVVPVWVEGDLNGETSTFRRVEWMIGGEGFGGCAVVVAYRPMDQVKIDIVNTEVLQSGIETLSNALMEGAPDLARDLPKKKKNDPSCYQYHSMGDQRRISSALACPVNLRRSQTAVHQTDVYPLQRILRCDTPLPNGTLVTLSCPIARKRWMAVLTKHNRCVYTRS